MTSFLYATVQNADMYRKCVVRVASTNIAKIILREGFIEKREKKIKKAHTRIYLSEQVR